MNNNKSHHIPNSFTIKVPFPPPIEESELKPTMKKGKLPVRATNQFLLYRTAVIKTLRESGVVDINMRSISKIASDLWSNEPDYVQQEYKMLANRAKGWHQKTAKYLTSYRLKDTISQRPLAPMPESTPPSITSSPEIINIEPNEPVENFKFDSLDYNSSPDIMNNHHNVSYSPVYYNYNIPNIPQYIITQPSIVQEVGPENMVFPNSNVYGGYNYNFDYYG